MFYIMHLIKSVKNWWKWCAKLWHYKKWYMVEHKSLEWENLDQALTEILIDVKGR